MQGWYESRVDGLNSAEQRAVVFGLAHRRVCPEVWLLGCCSGGIMGAWTAGRRLTAVIIRACEVRKVSVGRQIQALFSFGRSSVTINESSSATATR
jgi:hypothetical protein